METKKKKILYPPWEAHDIKTAARMWKEGKSPAQIGKAIGRTPDAVYTKACQLRSIFGQRHAATGQIVKSAPIKAAVVQQERRPNPHPNRVTRITFAGATCTMPRVTFIDGPAP